MKLYGYWRSSCSWRVRIALGLKGIDYEYVPVHLLEGEQHASDHASRNPMEQVPVLEVEHAGRVHRLGQSLAIMEFLEEAFPQPPLLPADPIARARTRQLAEIVNSGIQPMQNLGVLERLAAVAPAADKKAWAAHFVARGLGALEALARETAGRYLVGESITLADVCLVPQLYGARRFGVALDPFPTLTAVESRLGENEAFDKAHADRQPDALGHQ
jgi:maleylpyruvate isomerase